MIRKVFLLAALLCPFSCFGDNPLITSCYTADPSVHLWPGSNAIWIYSSHDVHTANSHESMREYRVFKTYDLVNWIDHGCVLDLKDMPWATSHAWAIDAVYRKGVYYLVYCAIESATKMFRTGLATSDRPQGPFKDVGFIKGVNWGQDPCLLVDDDDTPYLYWGSGGGCNACKLTDDLTSAVPGTTVDLKSQLKWVFEGPWVHKYQGVYYLSYPGLDGGQWPEHMYYATSSAPLGPYGFKGEYMGEFPKMAGTNHGSIGKIKDQWYFFYHSAWLSDGNSTRRSIHADYLYYNSDGTIKRIPPTKAGVKALFPASAPDSQRSKTFIVLEAENGPPAKGELSGVRVDSAKKGFSGRGYVTGFDAAGDFVSVTVNLAKSGTHYVRVFYRCEGSQKTNTLSINGKNAKDIPFPPSDTFSGLHLGQIPFNAGDNTIKITSKEGAVDIDFFMVTPEQEAFPPKDPDPATPVAPEAAKARPIVAPMTIGYTRSGPLLTFESASAEFVSIRVFTASGGRVRDLVNGVLPKGKNRVEWNVGDRMAAGIYLVRIRTGKQTGACMTAPVRIVN